MASSRSQKYPISILRDFCLFTLFVTIPTVVELSMWMGFGHGGCPTSFKVSWIIFTPFAFKKRMPSLASAAESVTQCRNVLIIFMVPLRQMGSLSWGILPRK
jgi:hypothetical protein